MNKFGYYFQFFVKFSFCVYCPYFISTSAWATETVTALETPQTPSSSLTSPTEEPSRFDHHEIVLGRWYEGGSANRLQMDYLGNYRFNDIFSIELGASLSLLEQWGPSLIGVLGKANFPNARSQLILGFQNERWPTWRIAENRMELYLKFFPEDNFNLSMGFAYRAVQYNILSFLPYSNWNSDPNGELDILYGFDWVLFRLPPFRISWLIWDFDHMRLFNMDNTHFTLKTDWTVNPTWHAYLAATVGVTGISGAVTTWGQSVISLGMTYGL